MEKIIIIGGGIAGLASLNALADRGINALLLEAGNIGTPKMCGEFIAPSAVLMLKKWDISTLQSINQIHFINHKNKKLVIQLPHSAGAYARMQAELELAKRARSKGAEIRENSSIEKMLYDPKNSFYTFILNSGEKILAKNAIVASGKIMNNFAGSTVAYYGIKTHLAGTDEPQVLSMHSVPGAYFGIVPVSECKSNFACIVNKEVLEAAGSSKQFFKKLCEKNVILQKFSQTNNFNNIVLLESKLPNFNLKKIPSLPNIFYIGDALASFPPAIGYGFAHSLESAVLAVEYFIKNKKSSDYEKIISRNIHSKFKVGSYIHRLVLNQNLSSFCLPMLKFNPWIHNMILRKIGYHHAGKFL